MKKTVVVAILALATILFSFAAIHPAYPASSGTIFIKPNGSVSPSNAPIQRSGQTYILTGNINRPIVVETNNIVVDGSGFTLQGSGGGVAVNLTCSNVIVQNMKMVHWAAGVLGVFDNNTVKNCLVTQCESGFKIYAKYYVILSNDIERNTEGIRIGPGGYNFIAGNNITNDGVGVYLLDSNNEIVQNNFESCSQTAIMLDNVGWSQTVYHNNFVNNQKNLVDYTYSNSVDRPLQSALAPWDNGSSGNYWSGYTGSDVNGDGVGDTPFEITTYFASNASGLYTFEDRYPLTEPYNIHTPITQIPPSLTPAETPQPPAPNADNQATAMSFLKNVIQLDLAKYTATLTSDSVREDSGNPSEHLQYSLSNFNGVFSEQTATASITISNNTLTSLNLMSTSGKLLTTNQTSDNFILAARIMQNYYAWTNDSEVNKMATLLNMAGPEKNVTEQQGNLDLQILVGPYYTTFGWSYKYNGADYPIVNLELENASGLVFITFSDTRSIQSIGNTDISISKQQAITIAENYVKNYAYPMNFANGTTIVVRNLTINDAETNATLGTALRNSTSLYPYWRVQVALDHIYPGNTQDISVQLWADNGTVFQATREVTPISFPNLNQVILSEVLIWFFSVVVLAAAVLVVALILIFRSGKRKQPNSINAQNT
jgi:parallel beta-helix repeat protein